MSAISSSSALKLYIFLFRKKKEAVSVPVLRN